MQSKRVKQKASTDLEDLDEQQLAEVLSIITDSNPASARFRHFMKTYLQNCMPVFNQKIRVMYDRLLEHRQSVKAESLEDVYLASKMPMNFIIPSDLRMIVGLCELTQDFHLIVLESKGDSDRTQLLRVSVDHKYNEQGYGPGEIFRSFANDPKPIINSRSSHIILSSQNNMVGAETFRWESFDIAQAIFSEIDAFLGL